MINILKRLLLEMPDDAISSFSHPGRQVTRIADLEIVGGILEPDVLYYGKYPDDIDEAIVSTANLLLLCNPENYSMPSSCNTIVVFNEHSFRTMLRAAIETQNEIVRLNQINNELLEITKSSGSVQKLLDYGSSKLHNPMLLVDVSFGYITSSGMESVDRETHGTWYYTIENGIMPPEYISRIMSSELTYADTDKDDPQMLETYMDNKNNRSYSIKVMQGNNVLGYIKVLVHNQELTPFDREVFLLLAKYTGILCSMLEQSSFYYSDPVETLITSILLQRIPAEKAALALKRHFSIKIFKNIYLIGIQFNINPESGDYISFAYKRLRNFFKSSIVARLGDGYIVLFDTDMEKSPFSDSGSRFYNEFLVLLDEIHCSANISFVFHNIEDISRYYEQTNFCIEYRYLTGINNPVLLYSEVYEYQMITALREKVDLKSLVHPAVSKLMDMDRSYGSNLTETLFEYVNNLGSITATAKSMYLHYNTVKKRLERIVELTSFNETNQDEIFRIMLSRKIMEITGNDIAFNSSDPMEK